MKNIVFSGKVEYLNIVELIQLIGNNGSTGILEIRHNAAPAPGIIYFLNGNPVDAHTGNSNGLQALYDLFGWQTGDFSFSAESARRPKIIHKNRMEIILDGLRMVDDGKTKILGMPSVETNQTFTAVAHDKMPEVKGPLIDYVYVVDEESFVDGQVIAQEGRHGGWIWVVLEGRVDIVKETANGPEVILRLAEGAFVGSFASFLPGDHVRSAAAIARGKVQLGVLDAPRLAGEFAGLSPTFRRILISLDKRLKEVTNRLLDVREKKMESLGVPNGLTPYTLDGDRKEKLFSIKNGQIAVVRHTDYGHICLAQLAKGDIFGYLSFVQTGHEPFSAAVYASSDLEVNELDEQELHVEYSRQSNTLKNLFEHTTGCISITTQLVLDAYLKAKSGPGKR